MHGWRGLQFFAENLYHNSTNYLPFSGNTIENLTWVPLLVPPPFAVVSLSIFTFYVLWSDGAWILTLATVVYSCDQGVTLLLWRLSLSSSGLLSPRSASSPSIISTISPSASCPSSTKKNKASFQNPKRPFFALCLLILTRSHSHCLSLQIPWSQMLQGPFCPSHIYSCPAIVHLTRAHLALISCPCSEHFVLCLQTMSSSVTTWPLFSFPSLNPFLHIHLLLASHPLNKKPLWWFLHLTLLSRTLNTTFLFSF